MKKKDGAKRRQGGIESLLVREGFAAEIKHEVVMKTGLDKERIKRKVP